MFSSDDDDSFVTANSDSSFVSASDNDRTLTLNDLLENQFSLYPNNFNVCHINAQSIPSHFSELYDSFNLKCSSLHAILVSESWLKPSLPSTSYSLPGFVLIRNDRIGKGGGGVAIYLKSHLSYKIVSQSSSAYSASPEFIFMEVDVGLKVILGVVYCPPSIDFFSKLENVFEDIMSKYTHLILMGDFNTCMLSSNRRSLTLRSIIESVNLNLLDLDPTHHTHTASTFLDLIITSHVNLVKSHGQFSAPGFSHHDLIFSSVKFKPPKQKPVILKQRMFSLLNVLKLDNDASDVNWSEIDNAPSIDDKVAIFNSHITNLFDRHAPIRIIKIKRTPSPWFSDMIRKAIAKRDRSFRKYKKDRTGENWDLYKILRNRCNLLVRNAKRRYIAEQIELSTPAGIWKFLRSLGLGKARHADIKITMDLNVMNTHFTTCDKLSSTVKTKTLREIESIASPDIEPFNFTPVSLDYVFKILESLKSKAIGSDNIGSVMIKYIKNRIIPALTHIINFSLQSAQYPDEWRKAYVLPLPKCPNPSLPNQFRPISILPFLSKVIESVVHKQITEFLTNNKLLNPFQSGFRAGHSTTTALLKVTEDIREGMENSKVTVLALIDFSNAFNAVDHDLLLTVLPKLQFSNTTIDWFSSYLKYRRQAIRCEQKLSEWNDIDAGVPQGGILSPLLFSLFINLLTPLLHCSFHMYADDLQIYSSATIHNVTLAIQAVNDDLARLSTWSASYGIQVNPDKCQAIIIGSSRQLCKINPANLPQLSFNSINIPFSPTVKDLGVLIDSSLNWIPYIKEISRKFYATLHSIIRLKHFLPRHTKISLVNSLLIPILDYADVCSLDITEEQLNKLDRLLNNGIRFIFGLKKYDHVSKFRAQLKWLSIRDRRNLRIVCLLFSILKDSNSPTYLKSKFRYLSDNHERHLRSSNSLLLAIPYHTTSFLDYSFQVTAVRLWNSLPAKILKCTLKDNFKLQVKQHYLESSLLTAK